MTPRPVLCAAVLAALPALAAPAPLAPLKSGLARGRNLLVVTLDTTRPDHLGCYGDARAETPRLDRLAAEGLRFTEAVSVAPVTLVAHSSLFTGTYPTTHGVRHNAEYRLRPEAATLAEALSAAGYDTAAFVSAFVLDARYGLDQGFARYDDRVEAATSGGFATGTNERRADRTTDAALAWLAQRPAGKPFFGWVHYFDPHAPYLPPAPYDQRFAGRLYDGEIAFTDSQVGRLLDGLAARGLDRDTVVLVAGDHGESLGEHGESTHDIFVYDATLRVPLLLRVPGVPPGVVSDRQVSLVDVLPTLLDLLGVKDTQARDGRSLVGSRAEPGRAVYAESLVPYLDFGWAPLHALRRLGDKYVLAPRPEYYDLARDPRETRNLVPARGAAPGEAQKLQRSLQALLEKSAAAAAASGADPEARERLESLGYLGGAGPDAGSGVKDPKDLVGISEALIQANALLSSNQPRQAIALLEAQLPRSPRDRSLLQALSKAYLRVQRLKDAERVLREFRAIKPKSDTSLLLAQILILDGRNDEAGRLLDEAAALDPKHGGVFIARGDLLARQGKKEEARAAYEKARQVDPYRAAGAAQKRLQDLQREGASRP